MHTRTRFTIGYLTGGIYMPRSGKRYSYKYQVKGKKYAATDGRERNINQAVGARFVVENDSLNPEVSTGHFALAMPDGILPPARRLANIPRSHSQTARQLAHSSHRLSLKA